jgi:hypothetical protein
MKVKKLYRIAVLSEKYVRPFPGYSSENFNDAYYFGSEMCTKWKGISFLIWSQNTALVVKKKHFTKQ